MKQIVATLIGHPLLIGLWVADLAGLLVFQPPMPVVLALLSLLFYLTASLAIHLARRGAPSTESQAGGADPAAVKRKRWNLPRVSRFFPSFWPAKAGGAQPAQPAPANEAPRPVSSFTEAPLLRKQTPPTLAGEAFCGGGSEIAHIDLIMGKRGSAAETAFANCFIKKDDGFLSLLAAVAPDVMCKPNTILFNKVTIKSEKQVAQMLGPAQRGVAMAVMDCVEDGSLPADEADDLFLCVGVLIHWLATNDEKIQRFNYQATKLAIKRAVAGQPNAQDAVMLKRRSEHPFASHR